MTRKQCEKLAKEACTVMIKDGNGELHYGRLVIYEHASMMMPQQQNNGIYEDPEDEHHVLQIEDGVAYCIGIFTTSTDAKEYVTDASIRFISKYDAVNNIWKAFK